MSRFETRMLPLVVYFLSLQLSPFLFHSSSGQPKVIIYTVTILSEPATSLARLAGIFCARRYALTS